MAIFDTALATFGMHGHHTSRQVEGYSSGFELMEVTGLRPEGKNLVVIGTIMGAMPTEAILTPVKLRKVFKVLSLRMCAFVLKMLVSP